jgi:hypothetical protein
MMKVILAESPGRPWTALSKEEIEAHGNSLKKGFEAHIGQ